MTRVHTQPILPISTQVTARTFAHRCVTVEQCFSHWPVLNGAYDFNRPDLAECFSIHVSGSRHCMGPIMPTSLQTSCSRKYRAYACNIRYPADGSHVWVILPTNVAHRHVAWVTHDAQVDIV